MARAVSPPGGHDRLVFNVRQLRNLKFLKLRDCVLDPADPPGLNVVPMPVVVAPALLEQLCSSGNDRGIREDIGARVDIAPQESILRSERGRYGEQTRARLAKTHEQSLDHNRVERVD